MLLEKICVSLFSPYKMKFTKFMWELPTIQSFLKLSFALSRSYWVGDISWTHDSLFLACVLKRGSLVLLTCLGELLTLVTFGCSIEFGPAEFIPLHPLITYRWEIWIVLFNTLFSLVINFIHILCFFFCDSVMSISVSYLFLIIYSFLPVSFCGLILVKIWHCDYVSIKLFKFLIVLKTYLYYKRQQNVIIILKM